MRIGLDAMGGDLAPAEQVKGAVAARDLLTGEDKVVLLGKAAAIEPLLADADGPTDHIELCDCPEVIGMADSPVEAVRTKSDSSIVRVARMHKDGELDAMVSAGNTGAFVAAAQMYLRRLAGVHRPGITVTMPTFSGPVCLCDVGANVQCRPEHLLQYGVMASLYAEVVGGVKNPRVGLLSVGEEEAKGNSLVKTAHRLLSEHNDIDFVGNVEGRDIFRDVCDVVVCEGFVGNVCLKLMEGLAEGLFGALGRKLGSTKNPALAMAGGVIKRIFRQYDYNEYGGAPLLGVNGICIIGHGSSNARAIYNAIRVAKDYAACGLNERIVTRLAQCARMVVND